MEAIHHPNQLPELPDLDEMIQVAQARREFYAQIADEAEAEVERCDAVLHRLNGAGSAAERLDGQVNDATYAAALAALGNHSYAGISTLAGAAGVSRSHVSAITRLAVSRGHVTRERRGRKWRFTLTEAGMEFVTQQQPRRD